VDELLSAFDYITSNDLNSATIVIETVFLLHLDELWT